jgi:signal transduction histidine kinase
VCGVTTVPPGPRSPKCSEVVTPSSKVDNVITVRGRPGDRPGNTLQDMRRRSWVLDGAIAVALALVAVAEVTLPDEGYSDQRATVILVAGLVAAGLAVVRRRLPLWFLAAAVLHGLSTGDVSAALPFAAYAVARYGSPARWVGLGVAGAVSLQPWQFTSGTETLNNVLIVLVALVLPAVLGLWVRAREELLVALRERAERAESEQRTLAREAVLEERARITREMHDVVGHRVSLMVLQAGAVDMAAEDPVRVRQLAGQLQDAGRRSLEELRQLIGLLTENGDEDAPLAPQPGLSDVDDLVEDARRAGLEVALTRCGTPRELDPTVGRTAYRVVQEALTNAGKHAPGGPVAVTLDVRDGELAVTVVNRRATRPPTALPSGGLGLIGLRERVRTVGGTLRAEPRLDGGFRVEAVMPT